MSERHVATTEDLATDEIPEQHEHGLDREPLPAEESAAEEPVVDEPVVDEPVFDEPVVDEPAFDEPAAETPKPTEPQRTPLFESDEIDRFRDNWRSLQSDFVDDPRASVQQADELVAEVMQTMATTFAEHKRTLEEQWSRGDEVQTEDLRIALQQYRVFLHQLLAV